MYSLTKATELLMKSYNTENNRILSDEIKKYNNHKIRHTFWVLEAGRNLLLKIRENRFLNQELINKAEICFILHDVWRLFQNDWLEVLENWDFEHWDISYEIVKDKDYWSDICLVIKYHNKFTFDWIYEEKEYLEMSDTEKKDTILLLNLLKDADKLQNMIYNIFSHKYFFSIDKTAWKLGESDISLINIEDFKAHKLLFRTNIMSIWDYYLWTLSFIFDLNFKESLEMLNFYNYFEKTFEILETTPWVSKKSMEIIRKSILDFVNK